MNCTCFLLSLLTLATTGIAQDLPDGRGKNTVLRVCGQCHGAEVFASDNHSRDDWDNIITKMADRGLDLRSEDYEVVITYLTTYLGRTPQPAQVNVNKASAKELKNQLEISRKEAEAIVAYRERRGRFSEWRDLTKIEGVDARKIEAKKELIVF